MYQLITSFHDADRSALKTGLQTARLPFNDLPDDLSGFLVYKTDGELRAGIGLETYGQTGLLRSLFTHPSIRGTGWGKRMVLELEGRTIARGIDELYLLTTTASPFFEALGYETVNREQVPSIIKDSKQFAATCPSAAIIMRKRISAPLKMLFVCVENSNRSQMAQAFARMEYGSKVSAYSAGSRPSGIINPKAIASMAELGYDLSTHHSKSIDDIESEGPFDYVVTMGCGDSCPSVKATQRVDWEIPDPRSMPPEEFSVVRDFIREKIQSLLVDSEKYN